MAPLSPVKEELVNLFALQPQQSTSFVNMAQLRNRVLASLSCAPPASTLVSTGLRLALDEQQQQEGKRLKTLCYSSSFAPFSDELARKMKRQDEELDRFIQEQVIHNPFNLSVRCWWSG